MAVMLITSCAKEKTIKGETVAPYGWANSSEKNENINYQVSVGNVVLSVIFSETILVPIILTGWYLFEPTTSKS